MHEMSVLMNMIGMVEQYARENHAVKVRKVVLEIGEMNSVVPEYVNYFFPDVTAGTMLADAQLEIETIPATVKCNSCGNIYAWRQESYSCPVCGSDECRFEGGRDFRIKQIEIINEPGS